MGLILKNLGFWIGIDFEKFRIRVWDLGLSLKIRDLGLGEKNFGIGMGSGSRMPTSAY